MTSPTKPDDRSRMSRGGSWGFATSTDVRATFQFVNTPTNRSKGIGFRTTHSGCCQPLTEGAAVKPTKPPTTTDNRLRVCRGGGWIDSGAAGVRAAIRNRSAPAVRDGYDSLGFRLTQSGCRLPLKGGVTP